MKTGCLRVRVVLNGISPRTCVCYLAFGCFKDRMCDFALFDGSPHDFSRFVVIEKNEFVSRNKERKSIWMKFQLS